MSSRLSDLRNAVVLRISDQHAVVGAVVFVARRHIDAGQLRASVRRVDGHEDDLLREAEHVWIQTGLRQDVRIDLSGLRVGGAFLQNGGEIVQTADEDGHGNVI